MLMIRKSFAMVSLLLTAIAFVTSPMLDAARLAFHWYDPFSITEFRLQSLPADEYIRKAQDAIADGDLDDAAKILEIGQEHGHTFDPELIASAQESMVEVSWRNLVDFTDGFINGKAESSGSIAGALAADYFIIGDLRDITREGGKAISGQDYDQFTLGLSAFGLATLVPGTGLLDIGASILKTAKKAGKLSGKMLGSLSHSVRDLVDPVALKSALSQSSTLFKMPSFAALKELASHLTYREIRDADFTNLKTAAGNLVPVDFKAAKDLFEPVLRPEAAAQVTTFTSGVGNIVKSGGPGGVKAALRSLEVVDTPMELARVASLAERTRGRTATIIRLLGKGAIELTGLLVWIFAALAYALVWLLGAMWTMLHLSSNIRKIVRGMA
jgi:hypothetical protein